MHPIDGSAATAIVVADGIVRYDAGPHPTVLACTVGELRAALRLLGPTATVAFAPHGTEPPAHAGVTTLPVTDAVKRVAAGRVAGTLDRTNLRYLVGPATVSRTALDALLAGLDDDALVHPLAAGPLCAI
jgi:hypothetical protein